jgi:glycerol-3-phosphate dehydrogenase (NAD(P)+)
MSQHSSQLAERADVAATADGTGRPRIGILGGGRFGRAVAGILAGRGVRAHIWSRSSRTRGVLAAELPEGVRIHGRVEAACEDAQVVLLAVPMAGMREVLSQYGDVARGDQVVVHAARGVEAGFVLPHQIIRQETCVRKVAALGGPIYAPELGAGRPVAAVLASRFDDAFEQVQRLCAGTRVKVHASRDVVGVEVAGAISNVASLAVGMADALSLGETARGILLTRGLSEAATVGVHLGATPMTFSGLAGIGDLIPRRVASYEHHLSLGRQLARGEVDAETVASQNDRLEGLTTVRAAVRKAEQLGIELPLIDAVDAVVRGEVSAADALDDVLSLDFDLGEGLLPRAP